MEICGLDRIVVALTTKTVMVTKKTVIVTVIQAYGMKTDTIWDIIFVK